MAPLRIKTLVFICLSYFTAIGQYPGFFNFEYQDSTGKLLLTVDKLNRDFLFVPSLSSGVGSNDLGLDRGKLNGEKVVRFEKHGEKLLLIQRNLGYRANSENTEEVKAVTDAFATSVLYGFKIIRNTPDGAVIDLEPFLLEDHNDIIKTLKDSKQGTYKIDKTRSAVVKDGLLSFPKNIELEALITYIGEAAGAYISSVTPTPDAVSIRQHVSFIELPDSNYRPRVFHTHSGYFPLSYFDYATGIDQSITKRFVTRHRLEKKNPNSAVSDPVEPIVYYVDAGCPEPIKSALIEGASWWSTAFEAAGFSNAFIVKELPSDAHPLDVRYNVIQWVHRSTRGWSYGSSITDPRTGEILKGHVSLGSLRVRQDYMIAQGILSHFYESEEAKKLSLELSLARLRQLSAHEVGHTIGLAHNFAASIDNRASVMDYPHPLIKMVDQPDVSQAYATGIGEWDKRAIVYGYAQTPSGQSETEFLKEVIKATKQQGLQYLTDQDARDMSTFNADAHLWDNGNDPIQELKRIISLREKVLLKFSNEAISEGTPLSELEKVLVPVYFMHRYQLEAVSKLVGGYTYEYAVKGEEINQKCNEIIKERQALALETILALIDSKYLILPPKITKQVYPHAFGYGPTRESFPNQSGLGLDEIAIASSAINHTYDLLLEPSRLNRIMQSNQLKDIDYINAITRFITQMPSSTHEDKLLRTLAVQLLVDKLLASFSDKKTNALAKVQIHKTLNNYDFDNYITGSKGYISDKLITFFKHSPVASGQENTPPIPPGSPIGMEDEHGCGYRHH